MVDYSDMNVGSWFSYLARFKNLVRPEGVAALGVAEDSVGSARAQDEAKVALAVITTALPDLVFDGFSTNRKVGAGEWLTKYDVYFRWVVTDKSSGDTWTSPEVHHTIRSEYDDGDDAPLTARAAGKKQWTVNLPDRTED